jgi:hypothetical protein
MARTSLISFLLTTVCKRLALLPFLVAASNMCLANADSDAIAREAARVAAETYARESVRTYLDGLNVAKTAASAAGTSAPGGGTVTLSLVDLGFALKDFAEAKTDKGKFHAGARGSVAIYALAGGPAAPAIALGLTVAMLIEGGLDASHQKKMLEIYKRIEEHNKRTLEIYSQLTLSEAISLQTFYLRAIGASANVESASRYLRDHCSDAATVDSLEVLDACVLAMSDALSFAQEFLANADVLFSWQGQYLSGERFLKALPEGTGDTLNAYRDAYRKVVSRTQDALDALRAFYVDRATEIVIARAGQDVPRQEAVIRSCFKNFTELQSSVHRSNLEFEAVSLGSDRLAKCALSAPLRRAKDAIEQFPFKLCAAAHQFSTDEGRTAVLSKVPQEIATLSTRTSKYAEESRRACP